MDTVTPAKNRMTATFTDPELERAYQGYSRMFFADKDRLMLYAAVAVYGLFFVLDYFVLQNARMEIISIRLVMTVGAIGIIWLTRLEAGRKYFQEIACFLMTIAGVSIAFMIWLEGSVSPPYYVGLVMTAMIMTNLVRIYFMLSIGALSLIYLSFALAVSSIGWTNYVYAAHFFTASSFVLIIISSYIMEIGRRDEYIQYRENQNFAGQLQTMYDDAKRSIKRKNAVLNTLTHIFKTPLHQIIGYAQILEQESLGPHETIEYKEFSSNIHAAGQDLLRTVQRILTYSRLDSGSIKLMRQSTTTAELIDCALSRLVDDIEERKLVVDKPERHFRIKVDGALMEQAIFELLSNAVEASPAKGTIRITTAESNDTISLVITDEGTGIDLEKLDEIENTLERTEEFLGVSDKISLGITLTSKIVQIHDGKLSFVHGENGGTIATLMLDRTANEASFKPPARDTGSRGGDAPLMKAS